MSLETARFDVVIVGGAIIGSAIAAFLARESEGRLKVLVVERDPSYRRCATTLSLSSIRVQFSTPENIAMSRFGVAFLKSIGDWLAVGDEVPDVAFREQGYLLLAGPSGRDILEANHRIQQAAGASVALLEPAALEARFPWLSLSGIDLGSLGLAEEGWFDAYALMQGFRKKALSEGVQYRHDEVIGFEREVSRIRSLNLASGRKVAAGWVVNAAGPGAGKVAAMAGLALPVAPRKRSVFVFECREPLPNFPLLVDPSGVYVRPEGRQWLTGWSPPPEEDFDCEDFEVDWPLFERVIWPVIAARVPAFEAIKPGRAWAGHYDMNTIDHNAILGPHPEVGNFVFANGFSGHGVQQSPAVGRGIAELILHGSYRSLDLSAFDYARFGEGRVLREVNVI